MATSAEEKGLGQEPAGLPINSSNRPGKPSAEHSEDIKEERGAYVHPETVDALSTEHREYLLQRHGTLVLDPIPAMGDADPYNWTSRKVCCPLLLLMLLVRLTRVHLSENNQSHSRSVPRLHVDVHCGRHHSCLSYHGNGSGQAAPGHHVPHLSPDCHSRGSTAHLEADLASLWKTPRVSTLSHLQLGRKYRLREEPRL